MASAVRSFGSAGPVVFLVNGTLSGGAGRQDEIKLETLAESFRAMGVTAINLGAGDARLGRGALLSAIQLSEDRFVSTSLAESPTRPAPPYALQGPFLVGGISAGEQTLSSTLGENPLAPDKAASWLVSQAKRRHLIPILMLADGREAATSLAKKNPDLKLIVYSASGEARMEMVGGTALITPGENGKEIARVAYTNGEFSGFAGINLGPQHKDDPVVSRLYKDYLSRVSDEKLLDKLPRVKTAAFAGSAKCGSCHRKAGETWLASAHSRALRTLELDGHGRDPDCVKCHVAGLSSTFGYRSRMLTPALAGVGCESCHGPGKAHSLAPIATRMAKIGPSPCKTCHTPNTSPGFGFAAYWKKIAH